MTNKSILMKKLFFILALIVATFTVNAQDFIIRNDGSEISAKVLEISKTEVRFKKTENIDGPTYVESVKDLLMIRFAKGGNTIFKKEETKSEPSAPNPTIVAPSPTVVTEKPTRLSEPTEAPPTRQYPPTTVTRPPVNTRQFDEKSPNSDESCDKGVQDARVYYTGKSSGSGWVGATTILVSPLIGVITAALVASEKPSYSNLNIPKPSYANNSEYMGCYQNEAHKTKKKKVWTSFGVGAAVWAVIILLASSSGD
jgi:hypothetical protein